MRQSLLVLILLNLIAAAVLIAQVESLIESAEVAAESLPPIVKQLSKPDADSRQMDYIEHTLASKRDEAQQVRVVVQLIALLLLVNATACWYVRRRIKTGLPLPTASSAKPNCC